MAKKWEVSYLLDFYGDVLTEKQRDVMVQYYNDDYSLAEIAENFGITRQGVRDARQKWTENSSECTRTGLPDASPNITSIC